MDLEKDNELLRKESLKGGSVSSHTHSVETLVEEVKEYGRASEFIIPERYYTNKLVILPVNVSTNFIYWEITEEYIRSKYSDKYEYFMLKVMEEGQDGTSEITHISVNGEVGSCYVHHYTPNKTMFAVLGIVDKEGRFIELLQSNRVVTPGDTVNYQDEVWMSKMADWMEIIHASLERIALGSSDELLREKELMKMKQRLRLHVDTTTIETNVSSHEFLGSSEMLGSSDLNFGSEERLGGSEEVSKPKGQ